MSKVYIVQGVHWSIPGRPMTAHATRRLANIKAAEHVNMLLFWLRMVKKDGDLPDDVKVPNDCTHRNHQAVLRKAQYVRARQFGCDSHDDLDAEDQGDVWIEELTVEQ